MMKGGILAAPSLFLFFLLTLASQGTRCAAETADHRLQVQEFHGKKNLEIQSPIWKLGHDQSLATHELSAVEIKHVRRMVIGHKGGSIGGGGSAGGGGGGAMMRPHNKTNSAAALPVPVPAVLALSLACGLTLSVFRF